MFKRLYSKFGLNILLPIEKNIKFFFIYTIACAFYPLLTLVTDFNPGDAIGVLLGVATGITWAYLACLIVFLAGKFGLVSERIAKYTLYAILFILLTFTLVVKYAFGRYLTAVELQLIADTNIRECLGFLSTFIIDPAFVTILVIIILISILLFFILKTRIVRKIKPIALRILQESTPLLLLAFAIGATNIYIIFDGLNFFTLWRCYDRYADTYSRIANAYTTFSDVSQEIDEWLALNRTVQCTNGTDSIDNDLKIVLVIGESHIKHHSSIYGYKLTTNPLLEKLRDSGNLIAFNDVVSTTSWTTVAVRNLLSTNDTSNPCKGETWYDKPYFPFLFKRAGWDVFLWDNQTVPPGENDPSNFSLTAYLMNRFFIDSCYTDTYTCLFKYDMSMVDDFKKHVTIPSTGNGLYLFHLMGQHFNVRDRYPENFKKFTAADIDRNDSWMTDGKKDIIAAYDNAHLYNDNVLNEIIDIFKDQNAVVVYISDHGEEAYDYRDSFGRKGCPENLEMNVKYLNEVPMFVWMSDIWKWRHPDVVGRLTEAVNKPLLADNVCQMIMSLGGIKSEYYIETRDVLNKNYICNTRIINEGSVNYDNLSIAPKMNHR